MNNREQENFFESIGRLDFEQARIKHVLFKSKLRALLYGASIDTEPVLSTRQCSLGKWIYDVAMPRIGHLPEVRELERVHDEMHVIARKLWQLHQQGQEEKALAQLSQIDETAQRLLRLLDKIERKAAA
ncbi:CZB domain-containing protein [Rufibacter latericius]|nr:CZB domain-containing protein [Rufibacter latericius]